MPERKGGPPYSERQATAWLAWLARGMQQHGQTVFLIEQLQPSWLSGRRQLAAYLLASRLAVGVLLGVLWAAIVGPSAMLLLFELGTMEEGIGSLLDFVTSEGTSQAKVAEGYLLAGIGALVLVLLAGLVVSPSGALLELWRLRAGRFWGMTEEAPARWRRLVFSVLYFVVLTLFCSLFAVLVAGAFFAVVILMTEGSVPEVAEVAPIMGVLAAVFLGPTFAVVAAPLWGSRAARQSGAREIQTVETLRWSWEGVGRGALIGLLAGLATALLLKAGPYLMLWLFLMLLLATVGAVVGAAVNLLARAGVGKALRRGGTAGLGCGLGCSVLLGAFVLLGAGASTISLGLPWFVWLAAAVVGGLAGTVFSGLQTRVVALKTVPNQGIRLSLRNAFVGGGLVGLVFGLAGAAAGYGFGHWMSSRAPVGADLRPIYGIFFGLVAALGAGVYAGLWYGGADVIYHWVLRLTLSAQRLLPLRLSRFLDYAAEELGFLQKVGGGYMFIHRYLLEHFAAKVGEGEPADRARAPGSPVSPLLAGDLAPDRRLPGGSSW